MKLLRKYRQAGLMATVAAAVLLSGSAGAVQIDIGGFANNGSLSIMFEGVEMGGDPNKLELLSPDALTSFSAVYDDDGPMAPIVWGDADLGSLVYNVSTGNLETLNALDFDFFELTLGSAVLNPANYVEITNLLSGQLVGTSGDFPVVVPLPPAGGMLFFALSLLLVRLRRR